MIFSLYFFLIRSDLYSLLLVLHSSSRLLLILSSCYSARRCLLELESVSAKAEVSEMSPTLASVSEYTSTFLRSLCVECLLHGNINTQRALELSTKIKSIALTYAKEPFSSTYVPHQKVVLLPLDNAVLLCAAPKNLSDNNKCVEAYYQLGTCRHF